MVENSNAICRTCLTISTNMFNLFSFAESKETSLVNMLTCCASIQVSLEDSLPNLICASCIKTLTVSYNFKKQCERSDKLLRTKASIDEESTTNVRVVSEGSNFELDMQTDVLNESIEYTDIVNKSFKSFKSEKTYSCELCDKSFMKRGNLELHLKTHTASNICKHCGLKCESYKALLKHSKEQHKIIKCQFCEKRFSTGNALNGHMRYHKKLFSPDKNDITTEYICITGDDNNEVLNYENLEPDVQASEDINDTEVVAQMVEAESFNCEICEYRFISSQELTAHLETHKSVYECTACDLKFSEYDSLVCHNKNTHSTFNCKICTKTFTTTYGLSGHMRHHITVCKGSQSIFYKCTIGNCTRKFSTLDYLRRHKPSHYNPKKIYLCNLCGKTYNSNAFYYHQKIHRNERPYMCSYCGNAYKLMCHLKSHMCVHTGVKRFECKKCGNRFTRSRGLKKHIDKHCGSKRRRKYVGANEINNHIKGKIISAETQNFDSSQVYEEITVTH